MSKEPTAYLDIDAIQKTLAMLATNRLRCCFSKSGLTNTFSGVGLHCWCYDRDENGGDHSNPCVDRKLVINEQAIGDARFGFVDPVSVS